MSTRLDELVSELKNTYPGSEQILAALRVPPTCDELGAVSRACEIALICLCDSVKSPRLRQARDIVRKILHLLETSPHLSRTDYRSLTAVPDKIDDAYRYLPISEPTQEWWRDTLREALIARLLLNEDATSISLLAHALRDGVPIRLFLRHPQSSPVVRITLLQEYLQTQEKKYSRLADTLKDTAEILRSLPSIDDEVLHPKNAEALAALQHAHETRAAHSPREKLSRLARDIGVAAVAQRREHHAPPAQRLAHPELIRELVRRSQRWDEFEQAALYAALLLGRLGTQILKTNNRDPLCHIEQHQHETWINRRLPNMKEFSRQLEGPGFEKVGRQLNIPIPRHLGDALVGLCSTGAGPQTVRSIEKKIRTFSRDTGQLLTLRRLTRVFEYTLENATPDEALLVLLGLQPQAHRNAAIHYFSPAATTLVSLTKNAIEKISNAHDLDALENGWSSAPPSPCPYFGYSFRAEIDSVRTLIKALKSSAELNRGRPSSQRAIDAYNARVALLTVLYLASTGARPTGNVLPRRGDISLADKVAIASEKDSLGYRSTRLAPLPSRFVTEVVAFEDWAASKQLLPRKPANDSPLLQLRTADGLFAAPTISALTETVTPFAEHWNWPNDMLRHLFRSCMWDRGCPSNWLRRTMGHHPPHAATDMPWCSQPQWHELHAHTNLIDEYLDDLGF